MRRFMLFVLIFLLFQECVLAYWGTNGGMFDKSPNGHGWNLGYNRKIQTVYLDYSADECITSFHRRLDTEFGTGVIGGMMGVWGFSEYPSFYSDTVYTRSVYQSEGSLPGGRYPFTCEFINLYSFGIFNDYDLYSDPMASQPMFTVGDASWSWDMTIWSDPNRIESSDSSYVIPNAWQGTGDVVYDPVSEYYYWTVGFKEGLNGMLNPVSCAVGKSIAPWDPESWVWSDYRDLRFDLDCYIDTKEADYDMMTDIQFAYAKDRCGNGTGKGIGVAVTKQSWMGYNDLSYTYTNNWGADSLSGSWKPNWEKRSLGLYHVPLNSLFDWVGETLTLRDSIGFNLNTNTVFADSADITIDIPYIMNDISVIVTEKNIVHVLCMVFPASSEYPNCIFPWTDSGFRAGYYDIRGEITETGVNWLPAVFIANPVDNDKGWLVEDGGMEFRQGERRTMSLSYAFEGFMFAGWMDKPWSRAQWFPESDIQTTYNYLNDGYLILSQDGGNSWKTGYQFVPENEKGTPADTLLYAANVTLTSALHEDGWTLATHGGTNRGEDIGTYAACQYTDYAGWEVTYLDHQQFLHVWYVAYLYGGIEEPSTVASDFELYQNYPNPFNPATEIKFSLADDSKVNLSVYNTKGQLVKTLFEGKKEKGYHTVNFDASGLNSGVYYYKLTVNGKAETRKMIMLK
ncbi:MAG TPA: T9SS type A sorting domain-containing protein [Clostridiales bacterium]|mgnify:CR=1 FL=1|nr:T9SS type A sorting domain-containing protein [Clostridiales bacterium]